MDIVQIEKHALREATLRLAAGHGLVRDGFLLSGDWVELVGGGAPTYFWLAKLGLLHEDGKFIGVDTDATVINDLAGRYPGLENAQWHNKPVEAWARSADAPAVLVLDGTSGPASAVDLLLYLEPYIREWSGAKPVLVTLNVALRTNEDLSTLAKHLEELTGAEVESFRYRRKAVAITMQQCWLLFTPNGVKGLRPDVRPVQMPPPVLGAYDRTGPLATDDILSLLSEGPVPASRFRALVMPDFRGSTSARLASLVRQGKVVQEGALYKLAPTPSPIVEDTVNGEMGGPTRRIDLEILSVIAKARRPLTATEVRPHVTVGGNVSHRMALMSKRGFLNRSESSEAGTKWAYVLPPPAPSPSKPTRAETGTYKERIVAQVTSSKTWLTPRQVQALCPDVKWATIGPSLIVAFQQGLLARKPVEREPGKTGPKWAYGDVQLSDALSAETHSEEEQSLDQLYTALGKAFFLREQADEEVRRIVNLIKEKTA